MRIVINRKNTLWTLLMSVMLIMSLTITSFADSNNANQEYDGSHVFTKSGEQYGDSTYTADEQAAFEVQKKIEALPDKLTLSDAAKISEVKKAFDSLTETQKKHIDESRAQRLSDLSDMIERLKKEKEEKDKAKEDESTQPKEETTPQNQGQSDTQSETAVKPALCVKNLWASQHGVGKVKFKWSKKDGVKVNGWNLKYRKRKIGGKNEWSKWTTETYPARTYDVWIDIPTDYVIEIHAQATGDKTWSTGIITCPAGGRYHAMKETHVINVDTRSRLPETKAGSSLIYHTALNLKVGKTIRVKPDYDYDPNIVDFNKRPKLYPQHLLYDIGNKSMITITKPDGTKYTGGIIDGVATIKATKAGKTTLIFRSPNGRTMIADVTITK